MGENERRRSRDLRRAAVRHQPLPRGRSEIRHASLCPGHLLHANDGEHALPAGEGTKTSRSICRNLPSTTWVGVVFVLRGREFRSWSPSDVRTFLIPTDKLCGAKRRAPDSDFVNLNARLPMRGNPLSSDATIGWGGEILGLLLLETRP